MRTLLVDGSKTYKITIPDDAKITFGPWAPPQKRRADGYQSNPDNAYKPNGTLRIYESADKNANIIAVFTDVVGFRDLGIGYMEQVAREEGATIWKDDENGYVREHKVSSKKEWVVPQLPEAANKKKK